MKKIVLILMAVGLFASTLSAAPGDSPSDQDNAVWQLAASGSTPVLLAAMSATGRGATNTSIDKDSFAPWMQIQTAQSGSLNTVFPLSVFYGYLAHVDGFAYNRARLFDRSVPPGSPAVNGATITCASDTTGAERAPILYAWNYVVFTESEVGGTLSGSVWTFADVPAGIYVLAFDGGLPTVFLTVE